MLVSFLPDLSALNGLTVLFAPGTLRTGRSAKVKEKKAGGKMNYGAVNGELTYTG
jgi:hypothetical protein